eukprot:247507_1
MADEFLFGFDCDELQNDETNYIPPAEKELNACTPAESEYHPIHFVDARYFKPNPTVGRSQPHRRIDESSNTATHHHSNYSDTNIFHDNYDADDDYLLELSDDDDDETAIPISSAHIKIRQTSHEYMNPVSEESLSDFVLNESEDDDDEYNNLIVRTLPFDFEKKLHWKPMNTVLVDVQIREIQTQISRTIQHPFDSDDDDSHSSSSSATDDIEPVPHSYCPYIDDAKDDDLVAFSVFNPSMDRYCSRFSPPVYDIVLVESSPLCLAANIDSDEASLEYLQCSLLNSDELYSRIWQTALRNSFSVRCGNVNGNLSAIKRIMSGGGCKVLQFVGHCCNPKRVSDDGIYASLSAHLADDPSTLDENYILLESDACMIEGEWMATSALGAQLNAFPNDIVIVLSPRHIQMANSFIQMGFSYVIGIQSFDSSHCNTQNNAQILDFLHHFYSAILNGECLSRAFELATTATKATHEDLQSASEMRTITSKLMRLNGEDTVQQIEADMSYALDDDDNRFVLLTPSIPSASHPQPERFIVFSRHALVRGEPIDIANESQLRTNWNNIQMKPFIGRARDVIRLFRALLKHEMICVGGRENDGRKSVIKRLVSFLVNHRYFCSQGRALFVADCRNMKELQVGINEKLKLVGLNEDAAICFVLFNVDPDSIHRFVNKLPLKSQCVFTTQHGTPPPPHVQHIMIDKLNCRNMTELFVQLCYYDFDRCAVETHHGILELLDGSPGNVKRVAAFYRFLCQTQQDPDAKISLDSMVMKLRSTHSGWMNESAPRKKAPINAHSLLMQKSMQIDNKSTAPHTQRNVNISQLQLSLTTTMTTTTTTSSSMFTPHSVTPSLIMEPMDLVNCTTLDDLLPILRGIPLCDLKRMVSQHSQERMRRKMCVTRQSIAEAKSVVVQKDEKNQKWMKKFVSITHLTNIELNVATLFDAAAAADEYWFECMAHIVSHLYDYRDDAYAQATFLDIFYPKMVVKTKLSAHQTVGSFMFCLGSKCNQLCIVYVAANQMIKEVLLTRNKNTYSVCVDQQIIKNIAIKQYIKMNRNLKQLLRYNGKTLIDKQKLFL